MKQELINRIQPNCLLPFSYMVTWINNLEFQNEPADNLRALILAELRSNGQLLPNGWELLVNNVFFETNASITQAVVLGWLAERICPTCAQLKQMIQDFKIKASFPLVVETPVLDLIELDFNLYNITNIEKNAAFMKDEKQYFVHVPEFKIKNFDLIKDANPYLIVERLKPSNKANNKKNGWKRDKTMMNLGGQFWKGWEGNFYQEVTEDYYRPNDVPLTNAKQSIDLMFHNYFNVLNINHYLTIRKKGFAGKSNSHDKFKPIILDNAGIDGLDRATYKQKINLRLRIGFKIGNNEKVSKPLKYFSIFAQTKEVNLNGNIEQQVFVSVGK